MILFVCFKTVLMNPFDKQCWMARLQQDTRLLVLTRIHTYNYIYIYTLYIYIHYLYSILPFFISIIYPLLRTHTIVPMASRLATGTWQMFCPCRSSVPARCAPSSVVIQAAKLCQNWEKMTWFTVGFMRDLT